MPASDGRRLVLLIEHQADPFDRRTLQRRRQPVTLRRFDDGAEIHGIEWPDDHPFLSARDAQYADFSG